MPNPSPIVTTAPTAITAIQCLPRLRPSQPQNLCTGGPPSRCLVASGPDVTAAAAQTEGKPRGVATTGSFRRAPWRYPLHSTRASGGIGRRAGFRCLCPKGCGGSSPPSPTITAVTRLPTSAGRGGDGDQVRSCCSAGRRSRSVSFGPGSDDRIERLVGEQRVDRGEQLLVGERLAQEARERSVPAEAGQLVRVAGHQDDREV